MKPVLWAHPDSTQVINLFTKAFPTSLIVWSANQRPCLRLEEVFYWGSEKIVEILTKYINPNSSAA